VRVVRIEADHGIERDGATIPIFGASPGLRPTKKSRATFHAAILFEP
jgi:hypothetical protein